jgi:RNA polymerase sigma-54 factor
VKPALQLRFSQQLTMTPQLQQAIKLLQLSAQELETELLEALEANPLLEREDLISEQEVDQSQNTLTDDANGEGVERLEGLDQYSAEESGWDDYYQSMPSAAASAAPMSSSGGPERTIEIADSDSDDLEQHLLWQLNLAHCTPEDTAIGVAIIDAINDDGYLTESIDAIRDSLLPDYEVEIDEVEVVLHRIQHFDPVGVGAVDVRDCLAIQLSLIDPTTPGYLPASQIIDQHLDLLAKQDVCRDPQAISRRGRPGNAGRHRSGALS